MFARSLRAAPLRLSTRAFSTTPRAELARMSIIGRLAASPEEVPAGPERTLVRWSMATNHGSGENQKTSWFRVASFVTGPQRDYLLNVPKGAMMYVDADAKMDVFVDAEGHKRQNLSLIARSFDVLLRPRTEPAPDVNDEGLVQERSG